MARHDILWTIEDVAARFHEAVVTAHHLQVDRDAFLTLVKERLDYFERKVAERPDNKN